jgi:hypothetical protein
MRGPNPWATRQVDMKWAKETVGHDQHRDAAMGIAMVGT